jgi:hypothetical protein
MDATEFANVQEALILVFGQFVYWLNAFLVAGGVLASLMVIWLSVIRFLRRRP